VSLLGLRAELCVAKELDCPSRTMMGTQIDEVLQQLAIWAEQQKFTVTIDRR
jgi:hypothetical protein